MGAKQGKNMDEIFTHMPPVTSVTLDDLKRFLREKSKTDECPVCGDRRWIFNGYGDSNVYMAIPYANSPNMIHGGVELDPSIARSTATIICINCGYTRLHDMFIVSQWVRSNPVQNFLPGITP